jgi:hypothetical protein
LGVHHTYGGVKQTRPISVRHPDQIGFLYRALERRLGEPLVAHKPVIDAFKHNRPGSPDGGIALRLEPLGEIRSAVVGAQDDKVGNMERVQFGEQLTDGP